MNKLKNKRGVTMAEVLLVVAIIGVLSGVAFVSVWQFQRSLGQLERDSIAKEIFVAAQNHLTVAYGEGYLGIADDAFGTQADDGSYYYIVNGTVSDSTALGQMLPFGSIDETVRMGGSYIIRYQKETGRVLDVFYCTRHGSPDQFNHTLGSIDDDYSKAIEAKTSKDNRKSGAWRGESNQSILGWYGGTAAATLATMELDPPILTVYNGDTLYATVIDPNIGKDGAQLQLIIEGLSSGTKIAIELIAGSLDLHSRVSQKNSGGNTEFTVMLDDITSDDFHFAQLAADSGTFIPGENIKIQAVAYSNSKVSNIANSASVITNSLFESLDKESGETFVSARIGSIRHLENLEKQVSNLGSAPAASTGLEKFQISKAVQTMNLDWKSFRKNTGKYNNSTEEYDTSIYYLNNSVNQTYQANEANNFYPISPDYSLVYDGKNHSISNIQATSADAGLFGASSKVTDISNLELIDFNITGTASAGALAGSLQNCTVTNVLARNKDNSTALTRKITATTDAGGLIGKMTYGYLCYSAAAVVVGDTTTTHAGGLVGSANDGRIRGCYSGGHTTTGSYQKWVDTQNRYDVIGVNAGGLVGNSSATIEYSYSTCSVSGTTTAAGFAASASGSITNCYATGSVDQNQTGAASYAFLASGTPATFTGNHYYRAINEVEKTESGKTITEPMEPYAGAGEVGSHLGAVMPIDLNADAYNAFVGAWSSWNPARAFDSSLVQYYSGRYPLKTVDELIGAAETPTPTDTPEPPPGYDSWSRLFVSTHYGDWPSPEVFFIND